MASFIDSLEGDDKRFALRLRKAILDIDDAVAESQEPMMSARDALLYKQEGVMKYALAATRKGVTFHSMVMYANPALAELAKHSLSGVKLQKGCINIVSPEEFDFDAFEAFLQSSAARDFSPVIEHYKTKVKKARR